MVKERIGADKVAMWAYMLTCRDETNPRTERWFEVLSALSNRRGGRPGKNPKEEIEESDTESEYGLPDPETWTSCPTGVIVGRGIRSKWKRKLAGDADVA